MRLPTYVDSSHCIYMLVDRAVQQKLKLVDLKLLIGCRKPDGAMTSCILFISQPKVHASADMQGPSNV